ncbi:MAG: hypothetical protein AB7W16_23770 [Candidatus Obscuribacterales bacterium]
MVIRLTTKHFLAIAVGLLALIAVHVISPFYFVYSSRHAAALLDYQEYLSSPTVQTLIDSVGKLESTAADIQLSLTDAEKDRLLEDYAKLFRDTEKQLAAVMDDMHVRSDAVAKLRAKMSTYELLYDDQSVTGRYDQVSLQSKKLTAALYPFISVVSRVAIARGLSVDIDYGKVTTSLTTRELKGYLKETIGKF